MKHFSFWYLLALALAMLLCGTAGAVPQTDAEQALSSGEESVYQADTVEQTEIDGKQTIIKTFELPPGANPEALRENAFAQSGYKFAYERTDKTEIMGEDRKSAEETFSTDAKDKRLIPDSIVQDGVKLPLSSLSRAENAPEEDSDAPTKWTATAVYSTTTYTERKVESGYRASAVYRGEISKETVKSVKYAVNYTSMKLPVVPEIPYEVLHPEMSTEMKAGISIIVLVVIALVVYIVWYARQHTAKAFIMNDEPDNQDKQQNNQDNQDTPTAEKKAASVHYVSATRPQLHLKALGYDETLYEIALSKRLAQKLVGKEITIESRTGTQTHTIRAFSGDKYSFRVIIPRKSKYESP